MANILSTRATSHRLYLTSDNTKALVAPGARLAAGNVYTVFPEVGYGSINERFISNPNAAGSIWFTFLDGVTPAVAGEGSFELQPHESWSGSVVNEVRCTFSAAGMAISAGER